MAYSEIKSISSTTKNGLAIASLVLAVIAMFGVVPLLGITSAIYCKIVYGGCNLDQFITFFSYSCFPSIAVSILAIIIGFISLIGSKKGDISRKISWGGIVIGFIYWPLALLTGEAIMGGL